MLVLVQKQCTSSESVAIVIAHRVAKCVLKVSKRVGDSHTDKVIEGPSNDAASMNWPRCWGNEESWRGSPRKQSRLPRVK